jgi:alkylation response protein AidB-like acyl-CoA dehydrogenase
MAKLYASEVCWELCQTAVRIHASNGYSTEYPVERFYRDAPLMVVGEGTNEIQRSIIGGSWWNAGVCPTPERCRGALRAGRGAAPGL